MNRLREIREAQGLTLEEVAEKLGTTATTISRLELGKRQMTENWQRRFADGLGVHITELLTQSAAVTGGMKVLGSVGAGLWHEIGMPVQKEQLTIPLGNDLRYPALPQYALKIVGDSMDKVFPDGQYIVCVPWAELGRELRNKDLIVIERRKHGISEATVKRVLMSKGTIKLMPESTSPRWQEPLVLNGSEDEEVIITALVIGRYEPL